MSSSLSSVVSNLVRAQMGTSVTSSVTDEDLDKHVAELILKEAKKKAEKYSQHGIRAYLRNNIVDSNAPKTNKRFLTSIIRSTDDHNKTVLRAQALAAEEVKKARIDAERKERKARAEEAVAAEKMRRSRGEGSSSSSSSKLKRRKEEDEGWDHWDGRTAERKKRPRDWETWDGAESDRSDDRHRDSERKRRRRHSRDGHRERRRRDRDSSRHKRHRHRSRSRSVENKDTSRRRSRKHSVAPDDELADNDDDNVSESSRRGRHRRRPRSSSRSRSPPHIHIRGSDSCSRKPSPSIRHEPRSPSPSRSTNGKHKASRTLLDSLNPGPLNLYSSSQTAMSISDPESRSSTPGPDPLPHVPSKMDKYFAESYDPRLDVAPLSVPKVPATGLINDEEFYGWDSMLELIRQRNEDRAERKRLERLGIAVPKSSSKIPKNKKSLGGSAAMDERWDAGNSSIMEIEYKKKGAVREWDMGKEGF